MKRLTVLSTIILGLSLGWSTQAAVFTDELVTNGNFSDDLTAWSSLNVDAQNNLLDQYALDGQFLTLGHINEIEAVRQSITIPADAGRTTLQLYYRFFPDATDAGDYLRLTVGTISQTIQATSGSVSVWTEYTLDISELAGQTVTLELLVNNNASNLSFADLDSVQITSQSYAELEGTVTNADARRLRNAEVTIKNYNRTVVWTGTTNRRGQFHATGLRGGSRNFFVIITKDDNTQRFRTRLTWATVKQRSYILE